MKYPLRFLLHDTLFSANLVLPFNVRVARINSRPALQPTKQYNSKTVKQHICFFFLNISKHIPLFNEFKKCVKFFFCFCFLYLALSFFLRQVVHFYVQFFCNTARFLHRYSVRMYLA